VTRRFAIKDSLGSVAAVLSGQCGLDAQKHVLARQWPRRVFTDLSMTLEEAGVENRESLNVEETQWWCFQAHDPLLCHCFFFPQFFLGGFFISTSAMSVDDVSDDVGDNVTMSVMSVMMWNRADLRSFHSRLHAQDLWNNPWNELFGLPASEVQSQQYISAGPE
jgi:UBX domain